jgi:hypothetical protein
VKPVFGGFRIEVLIMIAWESDILTEPSLDLEKRGVPRNTLHSLSTMPSWQSAVDDPLSRSAIFDGLTSTSSVFSLWMSGASGGAFAVEENEWLRLAKLWRTVLIDLSSTFTQAAATSPHLASVLLEALDNSLEHLLLFGKESDLLALQEWMETDKR